MKILISVDIEGVAGVYNPEQTRFGNVEYEQARHYMTLEANAAIQGAFDGGATQVYVNDSHGRFRNILADKLDPRAYVIQGRPRILGMAQGVELGVDGLCFIGYHSYASGNGILAHTINSFAFAKILIDGEIIGEAALYGAVAGEFGVPVIFASGDNVFIEENKNLFPQAAFVQTKTALGQNAGISLSIENSCELIRHNVATAVQKSALIKPFLLGKPSQPMIVTLHTTTAALADLFCTLPTTQRIAAKVLEYEVQSTQEAMRILNCFSAMSASLR